MNILYGLAFLAILYYILKWFNITKQLTEKLAKQHNIINETINSQITKDSRLLDGFSDMLFKSVSANDKQNNCNSMFLPASYSGIYNNEIVDEQYNYYGMK